MENASTQACKDPRFGMFRISHGRGLYDLVYWPDVVHVHWERDSGPGDRVTPVLRFYGGHCLRGMEIDASKQGGIEEIDRILGEWSRGKLADSAQRDDSLVPRKGARGLPDELEPS